MACREGEVEPKTTLVLGLTPSETVGGIFAGVSVLKVLVDDVARLPAMSRDFTR